MELICGTHTLKFGGRPLVMGVLNVTPDSFSDGGRFDRPDRALDHARRMAAEGADLIDIGAESTRPGAAPVDLEDEVARLLPVVEGIAALDLGVPISVDTAKPEAADRALAAGAVMINDVSGAGDAMLQVAVRHSAPVIAMHMRGEPRTMQSAPHYDDVVAEVRDHLAGRVAAGHDRGAEVLVDPGIGFGKTLTHNLDLLANLSAFRALGAPVVLGVSRKSFLDRLLGGVPVGERLAGTLAVNAWAAALDVADVLRVHDVRAHRQLAESIAALRRHRRATPQRRRVIARGIPCRARIGVTARERSAPQELLVDIEVTQATQATQDDLNETVDYAELAAITRDLAAEGEYRLVETLGERIAAAVLGGSRAPGALGPTRGRRPDRGQRPGREAAGSGDRGPAVRGRIESLRVRVTKPGAARDLGVAEVGAEIDWRP